jgi:hypothetical protein
LAELMESLPLSRGSIFEVIRVLGIKTIKSPGPDGAGRQAWVHPEDVPRLTQAAWDVHGGRIRIRDLGRPVESIGIRRKRSYLSSPHQLRIHALSEVLLAELFEHGEGELQHQVADQLNLLLLDMEGASLSASVAG